MCLVWALCFWICQTWFHALLAWNWVCFEKEIAVGGDHPCFLNLALSFVREIKVKTQMLSNVPPQQDECTYVFVGLVVACVSLLYEYRTWIGDMVAGLFLTQPQSFKSSSYWTAGVEFKKIPAIFFHQSLCANQPCSGSAHNETLIENYANVLLLLWDECGVIGFIWRFPSWLFLCGW